MEQFGNRTKRAFLSLLLVSAVFFTCGCATKTINLGELPPLLTQEELLRPYLKVAAIEVRRSRYGSPDDFTPADYSWAHQALREEVAKIGADAVIFPEVTVEVHRYLFFPISELKAKGTAIRFR